MTVSVAGAQLKSLIERVERLDEDIKALNDDKKEVFAEARANGYDVSIMKRVLSARRKNATDRAEEDQLFALYWAAIDDV